MMREKAPNLLERLSARPFWLVVYIIFFMGLVWFSVRVAWPASNRLTHGFGAYYSASRLLATGQYSAEVYDPNYFRTVVRLDSYGSVEDIWPNPPTTTLMFLTFARLDMREARVLWTIANAIMLFAGLSLLVKVYAPKADTTFYLLVFTIGLLFRPVISNFIYGQAYILMFLLLAISTISISHPRDFWGGLSLGLALSFKMIGWPLTILLVLLKRWRYLFAFGLTMALLFAISLLLLGSESWEGFWSFFPEITGSPLICVTAYQTTRSWLCHVFTPNILWQDIPSLNLPWYTVLLYLVTSAITLYQSLKLVRWQPIAAAVALVTWGILFAPLGEEYHQVVVLIPIVWLLSIWRRGDSLPYISGLFLLLSLILYVVPFPINHPRLQQGWLALFAYPRLYAAWFVWFSIILSPYVRHVGEKTAIVNS